MFNFLKKNKETIEVHRIGTFTVNPFNDNYMLEGSHSVNTLGRIELSFPTKDKIVSDYQINMLFSLAEILKGIKEVLPNEFSIVSVMIPDQNSFEFDSIDAEIVIKSENELKSIILKDSQLKEIINID